METVVKGCMKEETENFNVGDNVKVGVKVKEGEKERIQFFEGTVIAKKGSGITRTFTVRKISYNVSVERIFPFHSPNVTEIKVTRLGKIRRAKLYYLKDRFGKSAKVKERIV